jgi:hypothetical protein
MRELLDVLGVASIPSACLMFFLNWRLRKLEKKIDDKEKARAERDYLLVKGTLASIGLGEAQARELQKDGKVNGNTSSALDYATDVKHKIEDFYTHQGVENLK